MTSVLVGWDDATCAVCMPDGNLSLSNIVTSVATGSVSPAAPSISTGALKQYASWLAVGVMDVVE